MEQGNPWPVFVARHIVGARMFSVTDGAEFERLSRGAWRRVSRSSFSSSPTIAFEVAIAEHLYVLSLGWLDLRTGSYNCFEWFGV